MAVRNKLFWGWLAVEMLAAGWFGWQVAKAEPRPWSRRAKRRTR